MTDKRITETNESNTTHPHKHTHTQLTQKTGGGGASAGVRAEARGAVDSALHVCSQPQVLQSDSKGRGACLKV
jgi:hypothetical protein